MGKHVIRGLYLAVMALLTGGGVLAAEPPRHWTLRDAVETALVNNHRIKAAGYSAEAAAQGEPIARAGYFPGIALEESFTASNAPTQTFMMKLDQGRFTQGDFQINSLNHPSAQHNFKTALTLQQPLYNPATSPLVRMSQSESERGRHELEAVRQDTAFHVYRMYLDIRRATARLNAAVQSLEQARESLRLARVRSEAGAGLKSDELRARTHLSAAEQQQISARHAVLMAQLRLADLLALPEGARAEIAPESDALSVPPAREELLRQARSGRGDVLISQSDLDKAEAATGLARSAYLPTLSAFASYQMDSRTAPFASDNDAWLAGARLTWQIFDGFRRSGERQRAAAGLSAAREAQIALNRQAALQVEESLLRHEEAAKRLEVARHSREDAEETVRLLNRRFENSLATMAELLDAQTALFQVRAALAEAEADHALARGAVYHAAGMLLKEISK